MKKIVYLAVVLMLSSVVVNAQEKSKGTGTGIENLKKEGPIDKPGGVFISDDPDHVYNTAGLQAHPSFPGSFQLEVQKGLNTADNGAPSSFKGRVYVSFIVEKDGTLTGISCRRDPGYGFGKEVEDAIKKIKKKWEPGTMNGKPVRVNYSVPILIEVP
jgi:protein TonB